MKRTPLYNEHIKLKARMVEFGGWEMPVLYTGLIEEHRAVREVAGMFDVSHMGEFEFKGADALACVQYLTTNDIEKLVDGQAVYSLLCNEHGAIIDDVIVYRFNPEYILMVVNASNIEKDWKWVISHKKGDCEIKDTSNEWALIALQGPKAKEILYSCHSREGGNDIKNFHFANGTIASVKCIIARTGYTGEDGFEIFCASHDAPSLWNALLETGKPIGLKPTGLGARDTLRLEMKYNLYGHEINDQTNPLEAGLGWAVKLNKNTYFIGKSAIEKIKAEGIKRKCVGFQMVDQGIPREGYKIFTPSPRPSPSMGEGEGGGGPIGFVCSGTMSPTLSKAIGTGYVPVETADIGSKIFIDIRGKLRLAEIVQTPFYRKK